MRAVLFGGTGLLGSTVIHSLSRLGMDIVVIARRRPRHWPVPADPSVTFVQWDAETLGPWAEELQGADLVVNLVGQPVAGGRWTEQYKQSLWKSRVGATNLIVTALRQAPKRPSLLVQSSAVGYYGAVASDEPVDEQWPPGADFLARLCVAWEAEAHRAVDLGLRLVIYRFGVVLHPRGGALRPMLRAFRWFLGGPVGSGRQWFPWLHWEEVGNLVIWALQNLEASGTYNATAPHTVRMLEFCKELGRALHRPCWFPVPVAVLRILLGEGASSVLSGVRAVPGRLLREGYRFLYPDLTAALRSLFPARP